MRLKWEFTPLLSVLSAEKLGRRPGMRPRQAGVGCDGLSVLGRRPWHGAPVGTGAGLPGEKAQSDRER